MWCILQAPVPEDYILAKNETHTVKEFIEESFRVLGEELTWEGTSVYERAMLNSSGQEVIAIDPRYFRPTKVDLLIGNFSKAKQKLGWEPKTRFDELVKIMVKSNYGKIKSRLD
jgi:GDPmannose 4,6-dehydratase